MKKENNTLKLIAFIILLLITVVSLFFIFNMWPLHLMGPYRFKLFISVISLFGILGLVGLWLLFVYDDIEMKNKKWITFALLVPGFISSFIVGFIFSYLGFVFHHPANGISIFGYFLLLFALIVAYFTKKKLFK